MNETKSSQGSAEPMKDKRPDEIRPMKKDLASDERAMESGDTSKDAMVKTMSEQAKKAEGGSDDKEDGLNRDR